MEFIKFTNNGFGFIIPFLLIKTHWDFIGNLVALLLINTARYSLGSKIIDNTLEIVKP